MGQLEKWFIENQRGFPWRVNRDPYRVWISEVMLQQTRASVVIPYFERWMEQFPNVNALYNAKIEDLIKAWEGLGYYSRVRNIQRAAKQIVEQFGGKLPQTKEELIQIQGFGPYTVGAILSFAYRKRSAAVDGNVVRVISRLFCVEENVCRVKTKRDIEEKTLQVLDEKEPWVSMEALIELGATVCTPKPQCDLCPMREKCLGKACKRAELLPIKNEKAQITKLFRNVYIIQFENKFLVRKGKKGKVMADLYEFPYSNREEDTLFSNLKCLRTLPEVSHTFTRFKAHLFPVWMEAKSLESFDGYKWVDRLEMERLPFSSGHRKILEVILSAS